MQALKVSSCIAETSSSLRCEPFWGTKKQRCGSSRMQQRGFLEAASEFRHHCKSGDMRNCNCIQGQLERQVPIEDFSSYIHCTLMHIVRRRRAYLLCCSRSATTCQIPLQGPFSQIEEGAMDGHVLGCPHILLLQLTSHQ